MQNLELDSRTADELISLLGSITVLNDNLRRCTGRRHGTGIKAATMCSSVMAAKARKLVNELQEAQNREQLHDFARDMDAQVGVQK
jgi:hypothetical protein